MRGPGPRHREDRPRWRRAGQQAAEGGGDRRTTRRARAVRLAPAPARRAPDDPARAVPRGRAGDSDGGDSSL